MYAVYIFVDTAMGNFSVSIISSTFCKKMKIFQYTNKGRRCNKNRATERLDGKNKSLLTGKLYTRATFCRSLLPKSINEKALRAFETRRVGRLIYLSLRGEIITELLRRLIWLAD